MKPLKNLFEDYELVEYLQSATDNNSDQIDEGLLDWAKKAINYIKSKLVKLGNYFAALFSDGEPLQAVTPPTICSFYEKFPETNCYHFLAGSETRKIIPSPNSASQILSANSRSESTINWWKRCKNAAGYRGINESIEGHENPIIEGYLEKFFDNFEESFVTEDEITEQVFNPINEEQVNLAMSDRGVRNIDTKKFQFLVRQAISNPLRFKPVCIWGAPGIGKTTIIKQILKEMSGNGKKLDLIDLQLSMKNRDDFMLPDYVYDPNDPRVRIGRIELPLAELPMYRVTGDKEKDAAASKACGNGILFLDEISRAVPGVQDVLLKLINERSLTSQFRLGDGWAILCASNRMEDDPEQTEMGSALSNRLIHYNYVPTVKEWLDWAHKQPYMSPMILDWLEGNEKYWYYGQDAGDGERSVVRATPRSWEMACEQLAVVAGTAEDEGYDINRMDPDLVEFMIAGAVGNEIAAEFASFMKITREVNLEDLKLVWTTPSKAPLPPKSGKGYKLDMSYVFITMLMQIHPNEPSPKEFINYCKYLARLDDAHITFNALTRFNAFYSKPGEDPISFRMENGGDLEPGLDILEKAYPKLVDLTASGFDF